MKKYIIHSSFILACFFTIGMLCGDPLITFFLKPYLTIDEMRASKKLASKLHKPGKIISNQGKRIIPPKLSGIFASYGGFLTASNLDGQISFPLKHGKPYVNILVTQQISPMVMAGNTVHHWELIDGIPYKYYKIEKKLDPDTKVYIWSVTHAPAPRDAIIPLETIILFANPKYIKIPIGITPFIDDPNLILPNIYVKNGINIARNSSLVVDLGQYFGPLFFLYKIGTDRYSSHLTY